MQVNIHTGNKQLLFPRTKKDVALNRVASNTLCVDDRLYWVDSTYKYIVEYNLSCNSVDSFELPDIVVKDYEGITDIYYYAGNIYIVPLYENEWIIFKISDKSIFRVVIEDLDVAHFREYKCASLDGNDIYLAGFCDRQILRVGLNNLDIIERFDVQADLEFRDIMAFSDKLYLLGNCGDLYEKNKETEHKLYGDPTKDYIRIERLANRIILLPCFNDEINLLDTKTMELTKVEYPEDFSYQDSDMSKFYKYSSNERYGCFGNRRANYTLIYDVTNDRVVWLPMTISEMEVDNFVDKNNAIFFEGIVSIEKFVDKI